MNRGWISLPKEAIDSKSNNQIEGIVTLTGLVRKYTIPTCPRIPKNNPKANQWYWVDTDTMAKLVRKKCHNIIIELTKGN